jgi:hypothetical protein
MNCHVLGKIEPTKSGGVSPELQARHRVRSTFGIGETIGLLCSRRHLSAARPGRPRVEDDRSGPENGVLCEWCEELSRRDRRRAGGKMRRALARRARRAADRGEATVIRMELDRADMLLRIAQVTVTLVVAVERMTAGTRFD